MVDRIASFVQTSALISNNLRLQGQFSQAQLQLSSGFKTDTYQDIPSDATRLLNLETDYERITQQSENLQISLDRAEIMYSALSGMLDSVDKYMQDLSVSLSGLGLTPPALAETGQVNLDRFAGALNSNLADRFLFAGSNTNTAPVDLTGFGGQTYTAPGPSVADATYYQGNNYIMTVEATEGFNINYGLTADNPAFEQIIRAFDLVITTPNDTDTLFEAYRLMESGYADIAVLRSSLSQRASTMELQLNSHLEDLNLIDNQIVDIREINAAEVSVNLAQLETQLEASFSVTADLINLSLVDFIR